MWWPEVAKSRSRLLSGAGFAIVAGLFSLGAGGCGFHPLYGPTASGANLADVMKTVQVSTIPSRTGQRLRNELIFGTTGGGEPAAPVYRLDIALRENLRNTLVTQTGAPTGQVLQLDAEFRLVRIKDNEVVYKGYSTAEAAYDLAGSTGNAGSIYGDTRAAMDAQNRAARMLADALKTRIAAYLSHSA
ncbi:MAG TPA: LPS assembly lipoprotein LptE [Hyphomicrobiales bacterium]|nr:LPS assembly lipoprotein LptE [Hyphomicrobiales bacterium]